MDVDVSPEVTEEGIRIVEDFLRSWASPTDEEDVVMEEDEGQEASPEQQLEQLKAHVEKFLPQIESNSWLKSLLTTF